jgi:hypothetical protein
MERPAQEKGALDTVVAPWGEVPDAAGASTRRSRGVIRTGDERVELVGHGAPVAADGPVAAGAGRATVFSRRGTDG